MSLLQLFDGRRNFIAVMAGVCVVVLAAYKAALNFAHTFWTDSFTLRPVSRVASLICRPGFLCRSLRVSAKALTEGIMN